MPADVPGRRCQRSDQASRKHATGLQGSDAENLAGVCRVVVPVIDDVKNLGPDNAAKHHQDPKIPCIFGIDALFFGVAHTDP